MSYTHTHMHKYTHTHTHTHTHTPGLPYVTNMGRYRRKNKTFHHPPFLYHMAYTSHIKTIWVSERESSFFVPLLLITHY